MVTPNQKTWKRHLRNLEEVSKPKAEFVTAEQVVQLEAMGYEPRPWGNGGQYECFVPGAGHRTLINRALADRLIGGADI